MITMKDIAEAAGVSRPTVSLVLNGQDTKVGISEATRNKILETAEKLGYRCNTIARSMKTGKTNTIGFIGDLYGGYCMDIIKGINDIANHNGHILKMFSLQDDGVKTTARQCVEQRLDGVICRSLNEENLEMIRSELEPRNIPVVQVDSSFPQTWCSRVISDDLKGAETAIEHLIGLGHRRIGHVTSDFSSGFAKMRYDGYVEGMKGIMELNAPETVCLIDKSPYELSEQEKENLISFIKETNLTALFCGSDIIAMKVLLAVSEAGIKVPEDLSVVGYAGLDYSAITIPPLTSIYQDFREMGKVAARILCEEISGCNEKKEERIPVELIIRRSSSQNSRC